MSKFAIVIDLDRCIGCRGGCQVACKMEHDIALGPSRSKFYTMGPSGTYPDLEMYFLPLMCQQCDNPVCAVGCPTGACYKSEEDGVVRIDKALCIGCQRCAKSCPYEAIIYNKELRVSDKCDLCADRRERGEMPACVQNCAGGAIMYGDLSDPDSELSKLLAAEAPEHIFMLHDSGNKPVGCFILRRAKWIDTLPHIYKKEGACHG